MNGLPDCNPDLFSQGTLSKKIYHYNRAGILDILVVKSYVALARNNYAKYLVAEICVSNFTIYSGDSFKYTG